MRKTPSAAAVVQTYLARKPVSLEVREVRAGDELPGSVKINKGGHAILGKLGSDRVEIFSQPERVIDGFANTGSDPSEILRFTRLYGVLHRDDSEYFDTPS